MFASFHAQNVPVIHPQNVPVVRVFSGRLLEVAREDLLPDTWTADYVVWRDKSFAARVYMETEHFACAAALAPCALGHSVIVPKNVTPYFDLRGKCEERCVAECVNNRERRAELSGFIGAVSKRLEDTFGGRALLFEHGDASFRLTPAGGVKHAHLQLVPVPASIDMVSEFQKTAFKWEEIARADLMTQLAHSGHMRREYYVVADAERAALAWLGGFAGPDRFLRGYISDFLGASPRDRNWREDPRLELVESALAKLRQPEQ